MPSTGASGSPITIDSLARIAPLIAATGSPLSEYSLSNLFLFRRRHSYVFHEGPMPHVRGITYDGEHHVMPLAPPTDETVTPLLDVCDCVAPLGDEAPDIAGRLGLDCSWVEADSDYVFDASRLASLTGAKAKRVQAAHFAGTHAPRLLALLPETEDLARSVLAGWMEDVGREAGDTDRAECEEALDHRDALALTGRIVMVGDEPVAFLLAGPGADGGRIVHFAKGRRAFAGAYPWMFAHYAAEVGAGRLNFEQDLGKPGFAQAKRAFAPIARLRKYRLRRRP